MGDVRRQRVIIEVPERAPVWFRAAPGIDRSQNGLLGRMFDAPCLFDYFHASPSVNDVFDCMSKQLDRYFRLKRAAVQQEGDAAKERIAVPPLWILSPRLPKRTICRMEFRPMDGWPSGFWRGPMPILPVHLVVLCDIPETRDTVLMRILGRGKTFYRAIHHLHALPDDAWEGKRLIPELVAYRTHFLQAARKGRALDAAEVQDIEAILDAWQARAEQQGRLQQRRAGLCRIYEARFDALPSEVQAAIDSIQDEEVLLQWIEPFAICTPEEISTLVLGR